MPTWFRLPIATRAARHAASADSGIVRATPSLGTDLDQGGGAASTAALGMSAARSPC
jgi:hypothetical protein